MVADPRAVAERADDGVTRALAHLTIIVTEAPWQLTPADLAAARGAGLDDAAILHAVVLSAYFGHLNRVADAVGVELDYPITITPPHAEPATPAYLIAPVAAWPNPARPRALDLSARPGAAPLWAAWRGHALEREAPLPSSRRAVIAAAVAARLGDAAVAPAPPTDALDHALVAMADEVTRAPWRLGAATQAALRAAGLADDAARFDAVASAAACTTFSRVAVALAALGG